MRTELELIAESYLGAKASTFTQNPTANFIKQEGPAALLTALGPSAGNLRVKGSPGKGRWTDSPWLALLDPLVTTTPQRGYYVVYLFSASMERLALSLNQGITEFRNSMGASEAKERLRRLKTLIQRRVPEYKASGSGFSGDPIDLDAPSSSSRSAYYEAGHAFGISYTLASLPSEATLVRDLMTIVRLYRLLTFRGGITDDYDLAEGREQDELEVLAVEERKQYRLHRRIEGRKALIKQVKRRLGSSCQACGFDFEKGYGMLGRGYIEAHHLTPLSSLPEDQPIPLDPARDFAVLCSNCHRMIHRTQPLADLMTFRRLIHKVSAAAM